MPLPTISTLPTPPSRSASPATFSNDADTFFNAFPTLVAQINDFAIQMPTVVNGIDYNGTSTSSVTIGTGGKSFVTQAGKNFQIGQFVTVANTASPANYMQGQVTAYNSSTGVITINVTASGGSGTFAAWTISLSVSAGGYMPTSGGTFTGGINVTSGFLGVGNSDPAYMADIGTFANATNNNLRIRSSGDSSVLLREASSSYGFTLKNVSGSRFSIIRHSNDPAGAEIISVMRDTAAVGFNTTTPSSLVDINGTFRVRGSITFDSALPVAQGGTGATSASAARSSLGAAASGANSDITSLAGLTTALSILQGGTGATTAAGALAALGGQAGITFISGGSGVAIGIKVGSTTYYLMFLTVGPLAGNGSATLTYPVSLTTTVLGAGCSKYTSGPINDGLNLSGAPGLGSCAVVNGGTATSGGFAYVFGY